MEDSAITKIVTLAWQEWSRRRETPFTKANATTFLRAYLLANHYAGDFDALALAHGMISRMIIIGALKDPGVNHLPLELVD